ncbi:hypothetical protein DFJ73DRAFT_867304 [Zopfochytrium polystomum]|nr:hypothetical protein DFJ73DRAFT_867304 [Zopfochytrium polystomum]
MGCCASSQRHNARRPQSAPREVSSSKASKKQLVASIEHASKWLDSFLALFSVLESCGVAAALWAATTCEADQQPSAIAATFKTLSVQLTELTVFSRQLQATSTEHLDALKGILALQREHHKAVKLVVLTRNKVDQAALKRNNSTNRVGVLSAASSGDDDGDEVERVSTDETAVRSAMDSEASSWCKLQRAKVDLLAPALSAFLAGQAQVWFGLWLLFAKLKTACSDAGWIDPEAAAGPNSPTTSSPGGAVILQPPHTPSRQFERQLKYLRRWKQAADAVLKAWVDLRDAEEAFVGTYAAWARNASVAHSMLSPALSTEQEADEQIIRMLRCWSAIFSRAPDNAGHSSSTFNNLQSLRHRLEAQPRIITQLIDRYQDILSQMHKLGALGRAAAHEASKTSPSTLRGRRKPSSISPSPTGSMSSKAAKAIHQLDMARHRLDVTLRESKGFEEKAVTAAQLRLWEGFSEAAAAVVEDFRRASGSKRGDGEQMSANHPGESTGVAQPQQTSTASRQSPNSRPHHSPSAPDLSILEEDYDSARVEVDTVLPVVSPPPLTRGGSHRSLNKGPPPPPPSNPTSSKPARERRDIDQTRKQGNTGPERAASGNRRQAPYPPSATNSLNWSQQHSTKLAMSGPPADEWMSLRPPSYSSISAQQQGKRAAFQSSVGRDLALAS